MDSNEDEDISRQKSIVSKEEDKVDKLNLNKKKDKNGQKFKGAINDTKRRKIFYSR